MSSQQSSTPNDIQSSKPLASGGSKWNGPAGFWLALVGVVTVFIVLGLYLA